MKIKALSRSTASYQAPGSNVAQQKRNLDPALHPFERAREYTRALNATKLERMFAAPFVGDFGKGHVDGEQPRQKCLGWSNCCRSLHNGKGPKFSTETCQR